MAETTCMPEAGCKHTEHLQHMNNFNLALWKSSVIGWQNCSLRQLKFEGYKTRELQIISLRIISLRDHLWYSTLYNLASKWKWWHYSVVYTGCFHCIAFIRDSYGNIYYDCLWKVTISLHFFLFIVYLSVDEEIHMGQRACMGAFQLSL